MKQIEVNLEIDGKKVTCMLTYLGDTRYQVNSSNSLHVASYLDNDPKRNIVDGCASAESAVEIFCKKHHIEYQKWVEIPEDDGENMGIMCPAS